MRDYTIKKGAIFETGDLGQAISESYNFRATKAAQDFPPVVKAWGKARDLFTQYANTVPDKREALRSKNPELDAMLFFWGKVEETKTAEAMSIVRQMMSDYGIPESAIPGLSKKQAPPTLPTLGGTTRKSTMPSPLQQYRERKSTMPSPLRGFTR